jgi:hypothetical protein
VIFAKTSEFFCFLDGRGVEKVYRINFLGFLALLFLSTFGGERIVTLKVKKPRHYFGRNFEEFFFLNFGIRERDVR